METRSRAKRARTDEPELPEGPSASTSTAPQHAAPTALQEAEPELQLTLVVKWTTGLGQRSRTRINRLGLKTIENVESLSGLSKGLVDQAFSPSERPECLSDELHYRWTPCEACLSYPMDVVKTEFKLVAAYNGWEYVVLSQELGYHVEPPDRTLYITTIEFESVAVVLGNVGIRVSLIAYPVICVRKCFLDDIKLQLQTNPNFKGILTG